MIPAGWTIKRVDKGPFKRIELWRQYNGMRYGTVVDSLARNPENILYMLAEDLLAQEAAHGVGAVDPAQQITRDFPADNGQYMHRCCRCNELFHGHKRRVVCAICETTDNDQRKGGA